ncbi:phosphatase PAP2 family protein [[Mycobacterium] fortunisiensis]|nr:phosphatase PAP2 family protein [[Mycobacterium] fortunisiensis]
MTISAARHRWTGVLIAAALFGVAVYWFAVQTVTGQTIENAALRGADQVSPDDALAATTALDTITVYSLAVATLVVGVIALLRRQPALAVAGMSIVVLGQVITQALKRFVLPRPELVEVTGNYAHNSLPSGHTTIAMTILFALLVVSPYRIRGIVMFVALAWAVSIGAYTVTAKWHRASDTLAAVAVSLVVACAASHFLARTGRVRAVDDGRPRVLRTVFVILITLAGGVVLAMGTLLTVAAWQHRPIDDVIEWDLYLGAQSLASAGSILGAVVFWWTWRRLETVRAQQV